MHYDAMVVQKSPYASSLPNSDVLYIAVGGTVAFVAVLFLSVCVSKRRCHFTRANGVLPTKNHAIALKYPNYKGPQGLKCSPTLPSPLSSSDSSNLSPNTSLPPSTASSHVFSRIDALDLGDQRGFINFTLHHNLDSSVLQITINSCHDLPEIAIAQDGQCLLDPYVKLQLLPGKQHRVKTRLVRATRNPQYEETFSMYGIDARHLNTTILHFAVIAFDRYSRDTLLAEAVYPLKEVDLENGAMKDVELALGTRGQDLDPDRGQILISLCYQSATNRVTFVLLKARNLPKFDITGMADPYVKLYLTLNGQRVCKKKSHVKKRTLNPVYNESFVFELPSADIMDMDLIQFEIVIMDWNRVTKNEVMGKCFIGPMDEHWKQVRSNPRRQIADWHPLSV